MLHYIHRGYEIQTLKMAFVQIFCFWFSVRLGSIIIGFITLLQACGWLTFCIIWMEKPEDVAKERDVLEEVSGNDNLLKDFADEKPYMTTLAAFFTALIFSCVLLVIGSFQCKPRLLYPFILTYFLYVAFLLACHVLLMLTFKNEDYGLGHLILYSNIGGFIILYLFYLWVCVFSFAQIILELRSELDERKLIPGIHQVKGSNILSARLGKSYIN